MWVNLRLRREVEFLLIAGIVNVVAGLLPK